MNTVIVGQGAIGLLCYHRISLLTKNKKDDELVSLWPSKATSLTDYFFTEINGVSNKLPLTIADEQILTEAHIIIICVKSYQVADALKTIHHLLADDAIIILTHNGLGTFEEISYLLKPNQCLLALLLTQGANKIADYHVEHTGRGNSDLGLIFGELTATKQKKLLDYFKKSINHVNWQDNIKLAQWKKLAINCAINPISALKDINNGDVTQQVYQKLITNVIKEVVHVAEKEGIELSEQLLQRLITNVAEHTSKNTSSMRADVINMRRTEIDYINGYIHRLGEKHQLATPMNTKLWLAVKALEKNYLQQ
jgi:2-dehydropantoate 2-reductase